MSEFLATHILSGKAEIPLRTRWWPGHSKAMGKLLLLSSARRQKDIDLSRGELIAGGKEWDLEVLGMKSGGPMADHARLEADLVQAAMKTDLVVMEKIGEALSHNVREISKIVSRKMPEALRDRFQILIAQHVLRFIESVTYYMDKDDKAYLASENRRSENTLALATFATEWA